MSLASAGSGARA